MKLPLNTNNLPFIRTMDEYYVSYNIEMTEVTGGTFWKPYTDAQIAGLEEFPAITTTKGLSKNKDVMKYYPPIDLYNEKIRTLAKDLGKCWIRVSGSWSTKTYYDFDGHTNGAAPEGFQSILTKEQWQGVLDFAKEVHGKILISVANCVGIHTADEPWNPKQADIIFRFSKEYGCPIHAVEFVNEPNMLDRSSQPKGYTPKDYARDQDIFVRWVRDNYPETLLVGPCTMGDGSVGNVLGLNGPGGIKDLCYVATTDELLEDTKERLDVFSYHCYNGMSERMAYTTPNCHWPVDMTLSKQYLSVSAESARIHAQLRDKYCPNAQMWVTESGDAGGGGNTWGSTFLDVFRSLNELGSFALISDGIIFHNTFASSDYGWLNPDTFDPRPNYFAALVWKRLMGNEVYCCEQTMDDVYIYAHSRKDGKHGKAVVVINTTDEAVAWENEGSMEIYLLTADYLRDTKMQLNGKTLEYSGNPVELFPLTQTGEISIPAKSCCFVLCES